MRRRGGEEDEGWMSRDADPPPFFGEKSSPDSLGRLHI